MKKVLTALAVTLLAGAGTLAVTSDAFAQHRYRHHHQGHHPHHRGPGLGLALGGLAVGAIVGGAIASSRPAYAYPPGYYAPGYAPGYGPAPVEYDEPICTIQQQQVWDGFNWRIQNVQVCN